MLSRFHPLVALFALSLLLFVTPLTAQDAPPDAASALALDYGVSVDGRIDDRTPSVIYTFEGLRGDLITLDLRVTGGDLRPMLTLVDGGGAVVAVRDSAGSALRLTSLRLPVSDRFFLIVARFGYGLGTTSGAYTLALDRRGPSSQSGSSLRYGDSVINTITADTPQLYYTFRAVRGDVITARMTRMSGDLDPQLQIVDSAGVIMAENDDMDDAANPGTLDAQIAGLLIPADGVYVIIATRFGQAAGTSTGNFVLALETGGASGAGRTALAPLPIGLGGIAQGAITADQFEVWYAFEGRAGQEITIRAARTGGDLDTLIQFTTDSQAVLGENDDSEQTQNSRLTITVPADGSYLILVTRFERAVGTTTGTFTLTVDG